MRKGLIIAVSGFSGVGKGTVVRELVKRYENYALSVSATTREPRAGEKEGIHYYFVSDEKFDSMINSGEFLEHASYVSHRYGTPKTPVFEKINSGTDVILEIDVQGGVAVREKYPETVLVFVLPPSLQELRKRLAHRGSETEEVIDRRLSQISREISQAESYDYLIVNDDLDTCVQQLHEIIESEHLKTINSFELIELYKNK